MPELPDVERFRRVWARHASGRRVDEVVVTDAGILRNVTAGALDDALRGERFEDPDRHGKWLIAWSTGPAVLLHFGMTGDLVPAEAPEGRHPHDRVIFRLDGGEVRYRNMRKLGGLWLAHGPDEAAAVLGRLGPDALDLSRRAFHALLRRRRGRVKAALMDQALLAGVGNLLADDALWRARLHPAGRIEDLSDSEVDRLYTELRTAMRREMARLEAGSESRWLRARGDPAGRCPRCGSLLGRTTVGGRTTRFCPRCQGG